MIANAMVRCKGEDFVSCVTEEFNPHSFAVRPAEQPYRSEERRRVAEPWIYGARIPDREYLSVMLK